MDTDTDRIAATDALRIEWLECFVHNRGIAECPGSRAGKNVQPPRRDHSRTERDVARIHKVNSHADTLSCRGEWWNGDLFVGAGVAVRLSVAIDFRRRHPG